MMSNNLTDEQKEILQKLVQYKKAGKLTEPIIVVEWKGGSGIIGVPGEFGSSLRGHMDILCDEDYLGYRDNSNSKRIYTIRQKAFDAIENGFEEENAEFDTQINIGAVIHEMNNGKVEAIGFNNQKVINETLGNKELLEEELKKLQEKIIDLVKTELKDNNYQRYMDALVELKSELISRSTDKGKINGLLSALSFLGDIEGSISLMMRVWPLLYPLIQLLAANLT